MNGDFGLKIKGIIKSKKSKLKNNPVFMHSNVTDFNKELDDTVNKIINSVMSNA